MKTYVITGAGSGMGRAAAIRLSEEPDTRVILVGRRQNALDETRSQMRGKAHLIAPFDTRDADAWKKLYSTVDGGSPEISGVFANAGTGGENHYGESDRWEEIIGVNLTGTYVTIQESLPHIHRCRDKFRHILITSSCLARFGVPHYTAYCTAKTGLLGLTRSLAVELAPARILVNALCPGWVNTEMAQAGISLLAGRSGRDYEAELEIQKSYVPLGRLSDPEEIAETVAFLFSNRQTSITGQAIDINNGSYMQ